MLSQDHIDLPEVYEPEVMGIIDRFVRPGDCAIDVGAGIGFFTCMLAKIVGEGGVVLAFEPHTQSYGHLIRNVNKRGLNNVACFREALWSIDCEGLQLWSMDQPGYSTVMGRYGQATNSELVEGRRLDTLLINPRDQPRFIKIDCEGAEWEVLRGAEEILRRGVDCIVLEFNYKILHDLGRVDQTIRDYLGSLGYDMFLINIGDGNGGLITPVKVDKSVKLEVRINPGAPHWMNVMFSTEEKVKSRW